VSVKVNDDGDVRSPKNSYTASGCFGKSDVSARTRKEFRGDNRQKNRTAIIPSAGYTAEVPGSTGSTRPKCLAGTASIMRG
jgi:hypothetical protein